MGLAAPRKKVKLSHDPNNTKWSRSTDGFGHKIMTSQGWTPGSYLGARNAPHADTFTVASASHIRVTLKDDTLGLGARSRVMGNDEPTGLDAFQGLLGRLNGKSDTQLEKEQRKRDDDRLAIYAQKKYQMVNFVSGGYLAPEKSEAFPESRDVLSEKLNAEDRPTDTRNRETNNDISEFDEKATVSGVIKEKAKKKDKKRKAKPKKSTEDIENDKRDLPRTNNISVEAVSETPVISREQRPMGRHAIRGRHIQQKKRAIMDDRSLNEIFMIKT
ncbi:hypothetical protein BGW36DRAFT_375721 [Talaromyces proteolyticus]|uniref:Protein PXR1 n=1 Tax=Talaromyces proteolyticus TaxID=1131652 RepID=A0AAD4KW58_9EURO|nr:uncharacterized protein BGW36DRAFT_375721 [Talaromyces proteolyticus]KAH8698253.1 hypothetical protein BGW36DRAFT_375721 [Talaromyces proteolyticus]